jgi:ABC-type transport system involved in multi-copper enzyme maturation permease subunit
MLTPGRLTWWLAISGFPLAMTLLVRWGLQESGEVPEDVDAAWSMAYYMLVPGVCTVLGVLVTAGPAVAAELEQRSWVYLASRPHGILRLLLGKYFAAVTFGWSAALAGLSCSVPFCTAVDRFWLWLSIGVLSLFSASCYAAAFLLLGVVVLRRAMVMCMVWVFFVEVILGALPAVVNRLTMQYRLRSILVQWLPIPADIREEPLMSQAVGLEAVWQHVLWLAGFVVLYLSGALWLAHRREFTAAAEGDV